jgi:VWFA-related protein
MPPRHARLVVAALALVAALSLVWYDRLVAAQTPTFRSGVKLIDLDVYVTDNDGHFVKDLTRDDFEVIEEGKPQDIKAFTFVDLPFEQPESHEATVTAEPDVVTNQEPQRRIYVLLMDSPSTRKQPMDCEPYTLLVRRVANRFVDDYLQPGDLMAVVHVMGTFSDSQTFTTNKTLLHASVDRYGRGLSGAAEIQGVDGVARHLTTYRAFEDVANRLGTIGGRRKTILWIGAQMRFSAVPLEMVNGPSTSLPAATPSWSSIVAAYRDTLVAVTRNNVAIYPVDPCGLLPSAMGTAEIDRESALRVVAEDTGGQAVVNTNNFDGGFTTIVRDNSTYYVLGYVPATEYRDRKFHEVKVRVTRPGLYTIRARKGYTAMGPDSPTSDLVTTLAGATPAAREALRLPVAARGLSVSLFSAPFKGATGEQSVVIGGKVAGELILDDRADVGLSYQVFTQDNHVQVGEYKTFALTLRPDSRANVAANGLHFVDRLTLPPGRYEIRYAVDQPGGHVGSVVAPLVVPKFDDELSLSGVVLASTATADHFMLRDDGGIRDRLGANPTSERAFHRGDLLNTYAEVYSDDARLTANDLTVTGSLATADGKPVAHADARLRSVVRPGDGRWAYTVEMDFAGVPAGSYVVTLEAASTRHKEPVRRVIPIIVQE